MVVSRITALGYICAYLAGFGCGASHSQNCDLPHFETVAISLANEDVSAPVVMMSLVVDNEVLFRGPVSATRGGQYTYIGTLLKANKGVVLTAKSTTETTELVNEKEIWIREGIWIVITREHKVGAEPQLEISVSYETGASSLPPP
jgi:hypothetical protein